MPHLKVRGIDKKLIVENSRELIDGLTKIINCPRNWFTIEHIDTEYIFDGEIIDGHTFIELFWFDRGQLIKQQTADFLVSFIKNINQNGNCTVIFFPLAGENYCENGEFF